LLNRLEEYTKTDYWRGELMKFSNQEIEIAKKLHGLELAWHPQAGQYVFDLKGIIEKSSPFQEGVYFILDIKHFLSRAGSVEDIKAAMCWLPLWEDCRGILKSLGVGWDKIINRINASSAFENNTERLILYRMILEELQ
jgi:hypothetical protein